MLRWLSRALRCAGVRWLTYCTLFERLTAKKTKSWTRTITTLSELVATQQQLALGTTIANSTGAWSYTTGPLTAGAQIFTATATNAAGITSAPSIAVDPIITQAPTVVSTETVANRLRINEWA
jgi:hypothetical protein